ncbi:hypothetical protein SESBI_15936 [Sesbania bispinosa]|nr:hypothetical protein SESBI_15936 [Sesbania bispinosa]
MRAAAEPCEEEKKKDEDLSQTVVIASETAAAPTELVEGGARWTSQGGGARQNSLEDFSRSRIRALELERFGEME